jgi:hypothetical protein
MRVKDHPNKVRCRSQAGRLTRCPIVRFRLVNAICRCIKKTEELRMGISKYEDDGNIVRGRKTGEQTSGSVTILGLC